MIPVAAPRLALHFACSPNLIPYFSYELSGLGTNSNCNEVAVTEVAQRYDGDDHEDDDDDDDDADPARCSTP